MGPRFRGGVGVLVLDGKPVILIPALDGLEESRASSDRRCWVSSGSGLAQSKALRSPGIATPLIAELRSAPAGGRHHCSEVLTRNGRLPN